MHFACKYGQALGERDSRKEHSGKPTDRLRAVYTPVLLIHERAVLEHLYGFALPGRDFPFHIPKSQLSSIKSLVTQVFTMFFLFPFCLGFCGQWYKVPGNSQLNTSFLFMLSAA